MQDLLSLCPYVSNLHLQGCLMQRDLDDIPHFRFLKHFTIAPYKSRNNSPTTPQAAAVLLLKFPTSLSSLRLQGTHIAEFRLLPPLPTITEVHLCGSTSFISESLKMLPYLVKVSLEFSDSQATSRDIIPALKSIASMSKTTLRYLKYVTGANVLVRDTLAPLFNIPYLQSLAILKRNIRVLDITDGDLRQMVVAWPDLSSLTLPVNVQTSHLSLNSLRTLSTLKNVEYILLQVNNFVVELPLGHFTRGSIISPAVKVYLQRLFPSLFSF
ncbi:hypothetical protein NLJ89_g4173 [Agrocybe chaxingu]|uniref:Uncharacterized protein n=1 Tax=Agrocybe chaxingu TaxID=84603 RepID=A0A9W8K3D3_9AGAR|nr:hypothetical protein NLJ89_g4173 [Agrocybe chaxingu]